MTVVGQTGITYTYDAANRLTLITQGTTTVKFAYDAASRRTSMTLPNGIVAAYAYDAASQLTGITYTRADASLIGDLLYSYNALGHRVGIAGSLAATTLPTAMNSAVYDSANRVTNWNGSGITYDANGNMLSDGVRTYTWDAKNRLTAISGGATASFQYDAYGRRLSKTVSGAATSYLYDGANPVQELTGTTPSANILTGLGIDEFYRRTDASSSRDMLTDALGSIIALTDSLAQIKTQYRYEPYGATTATGEANTNPFQYTGRENDGTGVYYYRARYYSPTTQRFISQDPIGFDGGDWNLYAYVGNEPLTRTDPTGHVWEVVAVSLPAIAIGVGAYCLITGTNECKKKYPNHKNPLHPDRKAYLACISNVASVVTLGVGWASDPVGAAVGTIVEEAGKSSCDTCK